MSTGLYRPEEFRDNCGFGLIAHLEGEASHQLLTTAIESLTCMTHRGGIAADGKTGDGCGLLFAKPDTFLRAKAADLFNAELPEHYALGMLFMATDAAVRAAQQAEIAALVADERFKLLGWREVPVNPQVLGEIAEGNMPAIYQLFIGFGESASGKHSASQNNANLFVLRKRIEKALKGTEGFYICSFSADVVAYKGLMMPADLNGFYLDLGEPEIATSICVFHQRFSTNTLPQWHLAQPFRMLAHNGEINTIGGNRNWAEARRNKFDSPLFEGKLDTILPLVNRSGSDSSSLDNMLEFLTLGGIDLYRAARMVVPPAWQNVETMDANLRAFYEYNSMHMEPWDGPAGLVMTDGRHAVCMLDRNGLRPARYVITKNKFITVASEAGTYNYAAEDVVEKGRVGPGQILAVDTVAGELLHTDDIDARLQQSQPYRKWLKEQAIRIEGSMSDRRPDAAPRELNGKALQVAMKLYQVSFEERDQILRPLAETGQEAVGSMGDDTPMAVLSSKVRSLYDYFRQQFAQVTNPPIDPLREAIVMSLETCIGSEYSVFTETAEHARRIILSSPVLSPTKFSTVINVGSVLPADSEATQHFATQVINLNYDPVQTTLAQAVSNLCQQAESIIESGNTLIVLDDSAIEKHLLPVHALMATGAVHHRLVQKGLRCDANIIVKTGTARDPHHIATLIGFGATAVYPYLAFEVLDDLIDSGELMGDPIIAYNNYRKGINKGLLKILSKMGISTIASYRGAQLFEAVGIAPEIIDQCFCGVASRIRGADFGDFEEDARRLASEAWKIRKPIDQGGLLKFIHGGEYHAFNPDVVQTLQMAVQQGDYAVYQKYAELVNQRPVVALRDLLALKSDTPSIDIDKVEPLEAILKRFDSAGMSLGALSPEAHEALATAMNRMGGRSNSGEGGEDPARYGTERVSKIKQVASGRFGVTPAYLMSAEVLQIKVAQGAKPGEGGQLPGGKVNKLIARLRYSVPGVTLISPPPHHDIYSIEDLAQLIFDLKQVNPDALVSVKLVSEPGVGTIAAGVAKAYADLITISGYDGGTAASPLTSIRNAGSPWELGLSETHQALRVNGLRDKVRVQTDGGLKTGLDVIKAAILGAESFGFGTAPMVALGCKYLRICHLNNCATGVATQNDQLRDQHYIGTVEMAMNFFQFVARETREWMAKLGVSTMAELVGRTDLLEILPGATEKQRKLDFTDMLSNDAVAENAPQTCQLASNAPFDTAELAQKMVRDIEPSIENNVGGMFEYAVTNCDRSIGARLSGLIAKKYGNEGMAANPIQLNLIGNAGQSFGVWNAGGLNMTLHGDANDYVGKGMAGGQLVLIPPTGSTFESSETPIMGNTCLYGATGGKLYAAGTAGERFAVRNSGAHAVIESAGDHCCEYMTGGSVVVLGKTGHNFGAGMTGGVAYVLDESNVFVDRYNHELVEACRINSESFEAYRRHLRETIQAFVLLTQSEHGKRILTHFDDYIRRFWLVKPKAADLDGLLESVRSRAA